MGTGAPCTSGSALLTVVTMIAFDAAEIDRWADQPDATHQLPELVRRLILATCPTLSRIDMPSGSSVWRPGWDGLLDVRDGNAWVPQGPSSWEMGCAPRPTDKANFDYEKRTANPGAVKTDKAKFVFVTPRRWPGKETWASARRQEGAWADIRALDANDLVAWLQQAPAVAHWFARLVGNLPDMGWASLDEWWEHWSQMTNPAITPELVLAGRNEAVGALTVWAQGTPNRFYVQGSTRGESIAFLAACACATEESWGASLLARAIVVRTPDAWRDLEHHHGPLVLVRDFEDVPTSHHIAVGNGHHVLTPLHEHDSPSGNGCALPPALDWDKTPEALKAMGLSESKAHSLTRGSARRLPVLRRMLIDEAGGDPPQWVAIAPQSVVPLVLFGQWDDRSERDKELIAKVVGQPYQAIEIDVANLSIIPDSPLMRAGNRWTFVSQEEAWQLLAPRLTATVVQRFREVALEVLGAISPMFELPAEERYLANIKGKTLPHSDALRTGIARGLALMSTQPERAKNVDTVQYLPTAIVRTVLGHAAAWESWATLGNDLTALAEAAPDTFLDAVEGSLNGCDTFKELFSQESTGLFSRAPHTGLLWALERLAWSRDYFSRVAKILAHLVEIDPGGQLGNRPDTSLHSLFLPWIRFSETPDKARIETLGMLLDTVPGVGWQILVSLYSGRSVAIRNPPSWRSWAQDGAPAVTNREFAEYLQQLNQLLLAQVDADANRWVDFLGVIADLTPEVREQAMHLLTEQLGALQSHSNAQDLWDKLRKTLHFHRSFPSALWALNEQELVSLDAAYRELTPPDLVAANAWLFNDFPRSAWPEFPDPVNTADDRVSEELSEQIDELGRIQRAAAQTIYQHGGISAILELAEASESPYHVGKAIAGAVAYGTAITLAVDYAGATNYPMRDFGHGVMQELFHRAWWTPLNAVREAIKSQKQPPEAVTHVYFAAPIKPDTWNRLMDEPQEVQDVYWRSVHPYSIDPMDISYAAPRLFSVQRSIAVANIITFKPASSNVIIQTLEQIPHDLAENEVENNEFHLSSFTIAELFKKLDGDMNVQDETVARLEIPYIRMLGHDRPNMAIHREVCKSPSLFADLIAWLFRRSDGQAEEETDEQTRENRAHIAFDVFWHLHTIPGQMVDGNIDFETLESWVIEARRLCRDRDRESIGDQYIGQLLANAPKGLDGIWPSEPVRDLLDKYASQHMGVGLVIGKQGRRGVTTRSLFDGGQQERSLAEQYRESATRITAKWPFTAKILRDIAEDYSQEARWHDNDARIRDFE